MVALRVPGLHRGLKAACLRQTSCVIRPNRHGSTVMADIQDTNHDNSTSWIPCYLKQHRESAGLMMKQTYNDIKDKLLRNNNNNNKQQTTNNNKQTTTTNKQQTTTTI
jgi:hypothetical protein